MRNLAHFSIRLTIALGLLFLLSPVIVSAQSTDEILVELADEIFNFGDHDGALDIYEQAIGENPNNVRAQFMAGRCHLLSVSSKDEATEFLIKAKDLDAEVSDKIHYFIGEGHRFAYEFDEAIESYNQHKKFAKSKGLDERELLIADKKIEECRNAKELVANPVDVTVTNLGPTINTSEEEYGPVVSQSGDVLIYTSRRAGNIGNLKDNDNLWFEDVYLASGTHGDFSRSENMGSKINTDQHDAAIGLSGDGKTLYIYKGENNGDIYECRFEGDEWSKPKAVKELNSKYKETSICTTHEGRIYFSSDRPGGKGRLDLYVIKIDEKGKWGKPEDLSEKINTRFDEESPFYDPATNTLYFSSRGHNTMGGYDVFKSHYDEKSNTWSEPINVGFPINSSEDDTYFTIIGDGTIAYYSSFQKTGLGGNDLYAITFGSDEPVKSEPKDSVPEKDTIPPVVKLKDVQLQIDVKKYETGDMMDATVEIINKSTGKSVYKGRTSGGMLSYVFSNDETQTIEIYAEQDGYIYKSLTAEIPGRTQQQQRVERTISLKKEEVGIIRPLRNIYFDFDRHSLKSESYTELDKLLSMMNKNPQLTVEIAGHTDFVGPDGYNVRLSQQRANAVVGYLKSKGIPSSRIKAKGYGEHKPIASNDDFPDLNRRTEFIILSK